MSKSLDLEVFNNNLTIGDKIETNHMPNKTLIAVIKEINSNGVLLKFEDGSEALFPMRYIQRDFRSVKNG